MSLWRVSASISLQDVRIASQSCCLDAKCLIDLLLEDAPKVLNRVEVRGGWLQWAQKYMKTNFQTVWFTDECRATLDGPDGWSSGQLVDGHYVPIRLRRQQGGSGVMFWAGIERAGRPL